MKKFIPLFCIGIALVFSQSCKKTQVQANFEADIVSGNAPLVVKFTDLSTASKGKIDKWTWNFGDGSSSTEQHPTHTFTAAGSYSVTLTVLGSDITSSKTLNGLINVGNQIVATESVIELKTSFGTMYMWLYKQTPLHRANFLRLADSGFFDSTTFHRIIQNFVIQGGDPNSKDSDPNNDGFGGPSYTIPAEFVDSLKHIYGAVGAARDNNLAKASNGSQFYIVTNKAGTPSLNKNYTVFGKIIGGIDFAYTISKEPKDGNDRPLTDIKMDVNVVQKTLEQLKTEFNFVP